MTALGTPLHGMRRGCVMIDKARLVVAAVQDYFRGWVHPDAKTDEVIRVRHSSLIASHMLGGSVSAFVFAGYMAWTGAPGFATLVAAFCFLAPVGIALFLSRTGRLDIAHLLSAGQLAVLVALAAALTGGTRSFALMWLAIVPLEAALSADRRMMIMATVLAVGVLGGLHVATGAGLLPTPVHLPIPLAGAALATCLGAVAYAGALAANVQQVHRGAARALEASREHYRLIAENATDLITRHEVGGRLSFASLASRGLLGIEPDDLVTSGFEARLRPTDCERYRQAIARAFETTEAVSEQFRLEAAGDGPEPRSGLWLEMRCQRAEGAETGRTYVIAVTRDITRAKHEAIELARAREEAERANRAKTVFLATMSHELRTPLSAIIGFAEILHRELLIKAREPKHADYCRMIHQSGEHLFSLVKDLLDVSRIESGNLKIEVEPFALRDVVIAGIETLRPQADAKGLTLVANVEPGLPDLLADRRATKQILINLVSNAVKFTARGGTVSISARPLGEHIEITVADDGIGIPPEHIARIVQPFYQVETSYARRSDGVGLGLSIVRGLIDLHGGDLRIESEPGAGSRFIVTLPAVCDADETAHGGVASTEGAEIVALSRGVASAVKPPVLPAALPVREAV